MATSLPEQTRSASFLSQSQRPSLFSAAIITYILATSAVVLRFIARRLRHLNLWDSPERATADKYYIQGIHLGLGVHYQVISAPYLTIARNILLNLFVEDFFYSTATVFSKLSLLAFYRRIFSVLGIKWPIRIMVTLVIAWLVARYISLTLHCDPPAAYWDKSIENAHCGVNDRVWFLATVAPNFCLDLVVLILPMLYIKDLQVERSQKLIVFSMFTFGGFIETAMVTNILSLSVVAISIVLLVVCGRLNPVDPDVSWTISPIVVWAGTEVNLSVVTSCLPSLRPIYLLVFRGSANPGVKKNPRHFTQNSSTIKNKALATIGSKGRGSKSFPGSVETEEVHPFSIIREDRAGENTAGRNSNIDLEELQPPHDRVMVREDISVRYSNTQ
ncbi:hypothetical protein G7Y79_00031g065800 [Physcia stellaris]|nr:hypothetical protein G7Y79_00031g065800 [Physcia stellaris]